MIYLIFISLISSAAIWKNGALVSNRTDCDKVSELVKRKYPRSRVICDSNGKLEVNIPELSDEKMTETANQLKIKYPTAF